MSKWKRRRPTRILKTNKISQKTTHLRQRMQLPFVNAHSHEPGRKTKETENQNKTRWEVSLSYFTGNTQRYSNKNGIQEGSARFEMHGKFPAIRLTFTCHHGIRIVLFEKGLRK